MAIIGYRLLFFLPKVAKIAYLTSSELVSLQFWKCLEGESLPPSTLSDNVCIVWCDVNELVLPSRSLSKVSAVVQSVAGPVPFAVTADTRKVYSVPRSRPRATHTHA